MPWPLGRAQNRQKLRDHTKVSQLASCATPRLTNLYDGQDKLSREDYRQIISMFHRKVRNKASVQKLGRSRNHAWHIHISTATSHSIDLLDSFDAPRAQLKGDDRNIIIFFVFNYYTQRKETKKCTIAMKNHNHDVIGLCLHNICRERY
jgi:hypothetical protein